MALKEQTLRILISAKDAASGVIGTVVNKFTVLTGLVTGFFTGKLFADATASASNFEQAMDRVQARSGATAEQMDRLKTSAEGVIADLGIDAAQAAQGLEILTATSLGVEGALQALTPTINVATLEAISLDDAAKAVTDTLTIFGLSAQDIGQATDTLAKASRLENVTITELAEALREGGSAARNAGLDLQQTTAILDIFAASGFRGSEAGTALNALLRELTDPASQARQALMGLGDSSGDLATALDTINQAGGAGKAAIRAFGDEAGPGLNALLRQGSNGLASYTDQIRQNNGELETAAHIVRDNLNTSWNRFLAVLDQVRRSVVEPLLEPLKNELDALTAKIREAAQGQAFAQFRQTLVAIFTDSAKAVKDFIANLDLTQAKADLTDFFTEVRTSAGTFATTFGTIADGLRLFTNGLASSYNLVAFAVNSLRDNIEAAEQNLKNISIIGEQNSRIFEGMAARFETSSGAVRGLKEAQDGLVISIGAANAATAAQAQAQEELTIEIDGTQSRIQSLRAEYERLIAVGDTQGAGQALVEINSLLKEVSGQAKQTGQDLSTAFSILGLKTQQELQNTANEARKAFEQIRDSGTAAPEDIKRAFLSYAQTAIAAVKDSSAAEQEALDIRLRTQAVVLGVKDAYDQLSGSLNIAYQNTEALNQAQEVQIEQTIEQTAAIRDQAAALDGLGGNQQRSIQGYNELSEAGREWADSLIEQAVATDNARAGTGLYRDVTGSTIRELQNAIAAEQSAVEQIEELQAAFEAGTVSAGALQFELGRLAMMLQDPITNAGDSALRTLRELMEQIRELQSSPSGGGGGSSGRQNPPIGGSTVNVQIGGLVDLEPRTMDELARKLKPYFDAMNRRSG